MDKNHPATKYAMSPVDYEAWNKGYTPPSEHVLIHELSFGGATIKAASCSSDSSWWLVVKGDFEPEDYVDITEMITRCLAVERRKREKAANSQSQIEEAQRADTMPLTSGETPDTENQDADNGK